MVASMRPGSVIVDLAAEAGGNCALTVPGRQVVAHQVLIDAPLNLPASMPVHASQLYSRNLVAFVTFLLTKGLREAQLAGTTQGAVPPRQVQDHPKGESKTWELALDDEIIHGTCITHAGKVVHKATLDRLDSRSDILVGKEALGDDRRFVS
jgi:NAD/NADP transhydrogenase alpha subunit